MSNSPYNTTSKPWQATIGNMTEGRHPMKVHARIRTLEASLQQARDERDGQEDRGDALEELARIQRERAEAAEATIERLRGAVDQALQNRAITLGAVPAAYFDGLTAMASHVRDILDGKPDEKFVTALNEGSPD